MTTTNTNTPAAGVEESTEANAVGSSVTAESTWTFPASRKVHRAGTIHAGLRVPFREIRLSPSHPTNGKPAVADPSLAVYD